MDKKEFLMRRLHLSILVILKEIKRVCNNNDIGYFLDGGSCLGAIRHKGFIPWDDDADVGMLRDDYEKFKKVCLSGELNKEFFLQDFSTEEKYVDGFLRIRLNDTRCVIPYHKKRGYKHLGIFVDVFPFDYSFTNNTKKIEKNRNAILRLNRILENKISPSKELTTFKSKVLHFFTFFVSKKRIVNTRKKYESRLDKKKNREYAYSTYTSYKIEKKVFKTSMLSKTCLKEFEGECFNVPLDYDFFLKQIYGNYMVLPKKENRVGHLPDEIEFNEKYFK